MIVGVNRYIDDEITHLAGAANDAAEIRQRLSQFGNFSIEDDHYLVDEDASSSRIRQALSDVLWRVDESELTVIYFSGHGVTDSYGNGFIAPHDMRRASPFVLGIRMQDIREMMLAAKNKRTILLLLDCCFSGVAAQGEKAVSAPPQTVVAQCLEPIGGNSGDSSGRIVFASAGFDEISREISTQHRLGNQPAHPHGAFTYQLLEGLDGRAQRDSTGVSVDSLIGFVKGEFATKEKGHRPIMYGSGVSGDVWLARTTMEASFAEQIDKAKTNLLNPDDFNSFVRAARIVGEIGIASPSLDLSETIRSQIDSRLAEIEGPARKFLIEHQLELSENCSESFYALSDLLFQVNCHSIATADLGLLGLFVTLLRVIEQPSEKAKLQVNLLAYGYSPPSAKAEKQSGAGA